MSLPVHHYGVTVSDMDTALSFYRDALGLEEVRRVEREPGTPEGDRFARLVGVPDTHTVTVHLDGGGCIVELVDYLAPPGGDLTAGAHNNDVGAAHVCFEVDDVHERYRALEDEVAFVSEPVTFEGGLAAVYLHDPDGNVVEFLDFPGVED